MPGDMPEPDETELTSDQMDEIMAGGEEVELHSLPAWQWQGDLSKFPSKYDWIIDMEVEGFIVTAVEETLIKCRQPTFGNKEIALTDIYRYGRHFQHHKQSGLTVSQLIDKLSKYPGDMPVVTPAGLVKHVRKHHDKEVELYG